MRKSVFWLTWLAVGCLPQQNVTKSSSNGASERTGGTHPVDAEISFTCEPAAGLSNKAVPLKAAACEELRQLRATFEWVSQREATGDFQLQKDQLRNRLMSRGFWSSDSASEELEAIKDDRIAYYLKSGPVSFSETVGRRSEDQKNRSPSYLPGLNETWTGADEPRLRADFSEITTQVKQGQDRDWNSTAIQQVIGNAGSYALNMKTFGMMYAAKATAASASPAADQLARVESEFSVRIETYLNLVDLYALFVAYKILLAREAFPELMTPESLP